MANQSRQPKGVPTGGRFAAQSHAEVEISLSEVDLSKVDVVCHACGQTIPGREYLAHDEFCNDDLSDEIGDDPDGERFVYMGRAGRTYEEQIAIEGRQAAEDGTNPYSPVSDHSWSTLTSDYGPRHTSNMFDTYPTAPPDRLAEIAEAEWGEVTRDPKVRRKLLKAGVIPSDFASPDRDVRMWAHQTRGDLVFEGELMSNAYDLSAHGVPSVGRVMGPPGYIGTTGVVNHWSAVSPEMQLAYIDGYAAGIAAVNESREAAESGDWERAGVRDRGPGPSLEGVTNAPTWGARREGWHRALNAQRWADDFASMRTDPNKPTTISYQNPDGQDLKVTGVEAANLRGRNAYYGYPVPGSRRFRSDGSTTPFSPSGRIMFEIDQVLG